MVSQLENGFVVSIIVGMSMNKIVMRIRVGVDYWTAERKILASNVLFLMTRS